MSINAGDGSGNSSSGGASDNASGNGAMNPADMERMINDAVSKALGSRMKRERSSMEEMIQAKVDAMLAKVPVASVTPASDGDVPSEKLNLKALDQKVDTQVKSLQARLEASEKARLDAENKASQTRLRADLESQFARHMGNDSPHLRPYLNEYSTQFKHQDGATYRVTKDEFGDEVMIPADRAIEELFKGDLKHLVPSRSTNLPPNSIARGMPMPGNGQSGPRAGIFEREILHAQAMSDSATYDSMYRDPSKK